MLFFGGVLCSRIGQKQCCTKCVWYPKALFQSAHFCNKFQLKLFLFHWLGPLFLSSSSPKVGICSNRSNLHISSFLRFVPDLWIIDKHCNKIMKPATNKYVDHTPTEYKTSHFTGFLHLTSVCKILTTKLLKERNLLEVFVKEQCFEKKCFDNKKWKDGMNANIPSMPLCIFNV